MISWFVTGWVSIRNELALACTCVRNERILRSDGTAVTCTLTIVISVASSEYGVPLTTMNEKAKGMQHTQTCGQVDLRFWWRLSQQTIFGSRHIAVATRTRIRFGFLTWLRWIIVAAHTHKGYAPAIAGIWGREGGGVGRGLSKLKNVY